MATYWMYLDDCPKCKTGEILTFKPEYDSDEWYRPICTECGYEPDPAKYPNIPFIKATISNKPIEEPVRQ